MEKKKKDPTICCLQENHYTFKGTHRLKVKSWKKIVHERENYKKAQVAILIPDKIDFNPKTVTKDKEGHYIMIKGSIQSENIIIINM